jgi:hypothetical protein
MLIRPLLTEEVSMGAIPVTRQPNGQGVPLALLVTLVVVSVLVVMETIRSQTKPWSNSHPAGEVILRAAPGESTVPMTNGFALDSRMVGQFADGTHCTNLDGPLVITINNTHMDLYRLECNGKRGYVNGKWVGHE